MFDDRSSHGEISSTQSEFSSEPSSEKQERTADQDMVLTTLEKEGWFIRSESGDLVFRDDLLSSLNLKINKGSDFINRDRVLKALDGVNAYWYSEINVSNKDIDNPPAKHPVLWLPQSTEQLYDKKQTWDKGQTKLLEKLIPPAVGFINTIELESGEVIPMARLRLVEQLKQFHCDYNPERSEHENAQTARMLRRFFQIGILEQKDGHVLLDSDKLKTITAVDGHITNRSQLLQTLCRTTAIDKKDYELALTKERSVKELEETEIVSLPKSIKDLSLENGEFPESIVKFWEIGQNRWDVPVMLDSGEAVNMSELAISYGLQSLEAHRDPRTEELYITDPTDGSQKKFNNLLFAKFTGINPKISYTDNKQTKQVDFEHNPTLFFHKFLSHLKEASVLQPADFRRSVTSESSNIYNVNPKRITNNGYVGFSNADGKFARYYLGRSLLIMPTGMDHVKIEKERATVHRLTPETAGVFVESLGKKELLYTFDFVQGEQMTDKYQTVIDTKQIEKSKVAPSIIFNKSEMIARLQPYDFAAQITKRPDETEPAYINRAAKLNKPDFVIGTTAELFAEAGVGIHNLSWEEQLKIADASLNIVNRNQLVNFASKYGIDGVRSLVSMDQDSRMKDSVFAIPEVLGSEGAKKVFGVYTNLINSAVAAERVAAELYRAQNKLDTKLNLRLRQTLMERGQKLLQLAAQQKDKNIESIESFLDSLESANQEIILYTSMVKALHQEGTQVGFNDLKDTKFEIAQSLELANEEVTEMMDLYRKNYKAPAYPPEFGESLAQNLIPQDEANTHFYIIKHEGKITAFARFQNVFDQSGKLEKIQFGAFNLNTDYAGGNIGEEMMKQFLEKEKAFNVPITADCDPRTSIAKKYIEYGFVGIRPALYKGVPILNIEIDPALNQLLETKQFKNRMSKQMVMEKVQQSILLPNGHGNIVGKIFPAYSRADFSLCDEGYLLTQFVEDKKSKQLFCLFEKPTAQTRE